MGLSSETFKFHKKKMTVLSEHVWDYEIFLKKNAMSLQCRYLCKFPAYSILSSAVPLDCGNSLHKGQWRGALIFSLICARINGWVNIDEAGDLRRHRAHCDVTVMVLKSHEILFGPQNEYATLFTPLDVVVFTPWDVVVSNTSSSNIFEQVISRIFFEISFI